MEIRKQRLQNDLCFCVRPVTVQPCISYIHKPASELSVAALQLLFIYAKAK